MSNTGKNPRPRKQRPPAITPEDRENQLIGLAVDFAEKQLIEGTASSQIVTHYLKLATVREKKEIERISLQSELIRRQTESESASQEVSQLYRDALEAMGAYRGLDPRDDDED